MGILEKIEVIRRKPEHIRLRYVWFFVFVCMLFILLIWFFSIKNDIVNISGNKTPELKSSSELQAKSLQIMQEIEKQQEAIKNAQKEAANQIVE